MEEMSLEEKLSEAERLVPGAGKQFAPYSGGYADMNWSGDVKDVATLETDRYCVTAALYEQHMYGGGSGIGIFRWITYRYQQKTDGRVATGKTPPINIRDQYDPRLDRLDLCGMTSVVAEPVDEMTVRLRMTSPEGTGGLAYQICLAHAKET